MPYTTIASFGDPNSWIVAPDNAVLVSVVPTAVPLVPVAGQRLTLQQGAGSVLADVPVENLVQWQPVPILFTGSGPIAVSAMPSGVVVAVTWQPA